MTRMSYAIISSRKSADAVARAHLSHTVPATWPARLTSSTWCTASREQFPAEQDPTTPTIRPSNEPAMLPIVHQGCDSYRSLDKK